MTPCPLPPTRDQALLCPSPVDPPAQQHTPRAQPLQERGPGRRRLTWSRSLRSRSMSAGPSRSVSLRPKGPWESTLSGRQEGGRRWQQGRPEPSRDSCEPRPRWGWASGWSLDCTLPHSTHEGPAQSGVPRHSTAHPRMTTFTLFHKHSLSACWELLGTDTWTLGHPWWLAGTATVLVLKGTTVGTLVWTLSLLSAAD